MSSHFNYEIDENKLREKLRNMQMPSSEDSWIQFETYSDLNRSAHKPGRLPAIRLNINRTLVLPFVFGGIIILFSLLLFNFISIKNKNASTISSKPVVTELKPAPVEEKKQVIITPKSTEVKKDTVITPPVPTPTIVAVTPTVTQKTVVVEKVPTATAAAIPSNSDAWITVEPAKIYISPNIASEVLSHATRNETFTVTDQTTYFVKISFVKDGQPTTGFIRKDYMRKPGQGASATAPQRKTQKKAETLQSIQTPMMLSNGQSEEPELK